MSWWCDDKRKVPSCIYMSFGECILQYHVVNWLNWIQIIDSKSLFSWNNYLNYSWLPLRQSQLIVGHIEAAFSSMDLHQILVLLYVFSHTFVLWLRVFWIVFFWCLNTFIRKGRKRWRKRACPGWKKDNQNQWDARRTIKHLERMEQPNQRLESCCWDDHHRAAAEEAGISVFVGNAGQPKQICSSGSRQRAGPGHVSAYSAGSRSQPNPSVAEGILVFRWLTSALAWCI